MRWHIKGIIATILHVIFLSFILAFYCGLSFFAFSFLLKNPDAFWRWILVVFPLQGVLTIISNIYETIRWSVRKDTLAYLIIDEIADMIYWQKEKWNAPKHAQLLAPPANDNQLIEAMSDAKSDLDRATVEAVVNLYMNDHTDGE